MFEQSESLSGLQADLKSARAKRQGDELKSIMAELSELHRDVGLTTQSVSMRHPRFCFGPTFGMARPRVEGRVAGGG